MNTIYYLVNTTNNQRLRWYHTLAGARIAQRARNHRLGFVSRLERINIGDLELEQCHNLHGELLTATWAIEEDTVDSPDLLEQS